MSKRARAWKPKKVVVTWIDAVERSSLSGTLASVVVRAKLAVRETPGWLIHQDETVTLLARHYDAPTLIDDEPEVDNILVIPTGWVKRITPDGTKKRKVSEAPPAPAENS